MFLLHTEKMNQTNLKSIARLTVTSLVLLASTLDLHAQQKKFQVFGSTSLGFTGRSTVGMGDANNDGIPDFAIGSPLDSTIAANAGAVRIYSGSDTSLLHEVFGSAVGQRFGWSISGDVDINNDGFADLIIGIPGDDLGGLSTGAVQVISGRDASVLHALNNTLPTRAFGWSVSGLKDITGDGFDEFIVGRPVSPSTYPFDGQAFVYSGRTGNPLYNFQGGIYADDFGIAVADAGDVNNDGTHDIVVGAPGEGRLGRPQGYVRVYSGATGLQL